MNLGNKTSIYQSHSQMGSMNHDCTQCAIVRGRSGPRAASRDLAVQTFIGELAVEAFTIAILPGTAWLDGQRCGVHSFEPGAQRAGDKIGTVIRTQVLRDALRSHQRGEGFDDFITP